MPTYYSLKEALWFLIPRLSVKAAYNLPHCPRDSEQGVESRGNSEGFKLPLPSASRSHLPRLSLSAAPTRSGQCRLPLACLTALAPLVSLGRVECAVRHHRLLCHCGRLGSPVLDCDLLL